jgi:hypothetical protein
MLVFQSGYIVTLEGHGVSCEALTMKGVLFVRA